MRTWERDDADLGRPIAASLDRCAQLLGVDLAAVCKAATSVEPYIRAAGTKVWSLMHLERRLHPEAFGRRRPGGYITRRRDAHAHGASMRTAKVGPCGGTDGSAGGG
jgi:hypothetical protein